MYARSNISAMSKLANRIRTALANPLTDDVTIDPMQELAAALGEVGLEPESGGGAVIFTGRDPIIASPLPFATLAAVALMAKAYGEGCVGGSPLATSRRRRLEPRGQFGTSAPPALPLLRQKMGTAERSCSR
jgi:hypothetical protein